MDKRSPESTGGARADEPRPSGVFEQVSLVVPGVDPDRLVLADVDTWTAGPVLDIGAVVSMVFGNTDYLVRDRERKEKFGEFVPPETRFEHPAGTTTLAQDDVRVFAPSETDPSVFEEVQLEEGRLFTHPAGSYSISRYSRVFTPDGREVGRRRKGKRQYCLSDLEIMIHALVAGGTITAENAALMLVIVHARAALAGYLPVEPFFVSAGAIRTARSALRIEEENA